MLFLVIVLLTGLTGTAVANTQASSKNHFPVYRVIEPNVNFWEKIYTTYSTSEAVIHDREDLTKIFAVVPIADTLLPGSRLVNEPKLDAAKEKYSTILQRLAKGIPPSSAEEKRIAAMYRGASSKRLHEASESVRVQIGQKERFREGVMRSGAYIDEIKRIFRAQNLPEELAYLPHVESSFNPNAFSKAGASGLWQFTPSTGRQYLRIDHAIDERQDPIIATHAAAQLLKHNHSVLDSWPLALTAYNYGTAGMSRAQKAKGSYERIFLEYEEGHFKFASRNFYPEFLAALRSAKKLEQSPGLHRHKPALTTTVHLASNTSMATISQRYKIDNNTIKELNPAIQPAVFEGKKHIPKGYPLKLPVSSTKKKIQSAAIATPLHGNR